jgi:hypothetical protein
MGSDIAHVKASIKSAPRAISKPESVPDMDRQDRGEVFEIGPIVLTATTGLVAASLS